MRDRLTEQPGDSSWVLAAKISLRDELDEYRAALTGAMVRTADGDTGRFLAHHDRAAGRFAAARGSAASERDQSVPVLTVVVSELRRLVLAATRPRNGEAAARTDRGSRPAAGQTCQGVVSSRASRAAAWRSVRSPERVHSART